MNKSLKDCLDAVPRPIERAVVNGRISGAPFVRLSNDAACVFRGFEVITELLQVDLVRAGDDGDEDRLMTHGFQC